MLILVKPFFEVLSNNTTYAISELAHEEDVNLNILEILQKIFPRQEIRRLGQTDFYTINVLGTEEPEPYITRLNNEIIGTMDITVGDQTFPANINTSTFARDVTTDFPITDKALKTPAQREIIKQRGQKLNGLKDKLSQVMLNNTYLPGVSFMQSDLNGGQFKNSVLAVANFEETHIHNEVDFSDADLRFANFSNAKIDRTHVDSYINFSGADLRSANFYNVDTIVDDGSPDINYSSVINLSGTDLRNANFKEAHFYGVDFSGADLRGVKYDVYTLIEKCDFTGTKFSSEEDRTELLFNNNAETEDEAEAEAATQKFFRDNREILSSADVKEGDYLPETEADDDDEEDMDQTPPPRPPICIDSVDSREKNIQAYLKKDPANFIFKNPGTSNTYQCANLNNIKRFHIRTDKVEIKYFNYVYPCKEDRGYLTITEDKYTRQKPYIRIGTSNYIVEKPDWFPAVEFPLEPRVFALIPNDTKSTMVTETMIRRGEKGDEDYASSEWHCSAGLMETYKLIPLDDESFRGGEKIKKYTRSKSKHKHSKHKHSKHKKYSKHKHSKHKKHTLKHSKHKKHTLKHSRRKHKESIRKAKNAF